MNYNIVNTKFKITNYEKSAFILDINTNIKYNITTFLGSGSMGHVYRLEYNNKYYVIKIAIDNDNLLAEINLIKMHFMENNIVHCYYPLIYGMIENINLIGVIYPYLGKYNLENLNYTIDFESNINIIKQIITQLDNLNKFVIHGDLKPSNVVLNQYNASIIDFGLIKSVKMPDGIITTNYITSPESLIEYKPENNIDYSKHDYFGLFVIVIDLFISKGYWYIISRYFVKQLKIKNELLYKHEASNIFVYTWYKFNPEQELPDIFKKLMNKIENDFNINNANNFYNFSKFFFQYIMPYIVPNSFNYKKTAEFKDFLNNLIQINPNNRMNLELLLQHPFLN
jgi:serine/threonine protein kinase